MWVWGREFLARRSRRLQRQLEIDKHWLHFLLWGRLGYDPTLDDERIAALVGQRFPGVDARKLLAAWQDASMIYPLVTGFHWADFDFQWYIEGCRSRPGPGEDRERLPQRGDLHQPARASGHGQHHDSRVRRRRDRGEDARRHDAAAGGGPDRRARRPRARRTCEKLDERSRARNRGISAPPSTTCSSWRSWASTTRRRSAAPPSSRCSGDARCRASAKGSGTSELARQHWSKYTGSAPAPNTEIRSGRIAWAWSTGGSSPTKSPTTSPSPPSRSRRVEPSAARDQRGPAPRSAP